MHNLYEGFVFSANIIVPMLLLLLLGYWLRERNQINETLISGLNNLVFNYSLPAMLFFSVAKSKAAMAQQWLFILVGLLSVLVLYLVSWAVGQRSFVPSDRGVFVQGVFRSNLAVVGLALVQNVYANDVVGIGAIFAGAVALFLNIMGVITLTQFTAERTGLSFLLLLKIIKNPLIISILLALPFKGWDIELPIIVSKFGQYVSSLALPLAMFCAGASFQIKGIASGRGVAIWASLGKMLLAPAVFVFLGILFGFEKHYLGILFLMGAAPAATAGYIMARAMPGNNATVAANIITLTNIGSLFVIGLALAFFEAWGWK